MNFRLLSFIIVWLFFSGAALCQLKPGLELPTFTAQSPNVASLGQYGDYPVDPSTGVPDISIPLYTIKGSRLELPITLSYHAGGIKVDQESSFVGLGWVLNAGGLISRVVRGRPDEEPTAGFLTSGSSLPDYNSLDDMQGVGNVGNNNSLVNSFAFIDNEPDKFLISANGFQNEFCLDNSKQFVSIGLDSIDYNINLYTKELIVKDKRGTIYRFGKALDGTATYETTTTSYSTSDNGNTSSSPGLWPYPSAYYLTEIISADYADTISFKYRTGLYSDGKTVNNTRYILNDAFGLSPVDHLGRSFDGTSITTMSISVSNLQIPDKIIFKNGIIEFSTVEDRLDLRGVNKTRITGFTVYDNKRNIISKVLFQNTGYFERTAIGNPTDNLTVFDYRRKSLKLDGVRFYDKYNVLISDYKFEYDPRPLPPRNTTCQDSWGYYNGRNNPTLIPQSFFTTSGSGKPVYVGSDRRSDSSFMKAGVLRKIIYPTGGYTLYDYEPNYYLRQQQWDNKVRRTKRISLFAINRLPSCDPDFLTGVPPNNSIEFEVTEDLGGVSSAYLYVMFTDLKVPQSLMPMTFKLTNLSTNEIYYYEQPPNDNDTRKVVDEMITIHQGDRFRMEARTNGATGSVVSICNSPYIESGLSYEYWESAPISEVIPEAAGGLRVKSILNFDINNKLLTKKVYEYGDTRYRVGVGRLITDPSKNFYNSKVLYAISSEIQELKNVIYFGANSQVEIGLNKGCPVDYDRVCEKVVSNDTDIPNGKTEYMYSLTEGDYEPMSGYRHPYNTIVYPDWKRGRPLMVKQYRFENNGYTPIQSVEYQYTQLPEKRIKTLKVIEIEPDIWYGEYRGLPNPGWQFLYNNPNRFYYYNYYVSRGKFIKTKEISKDFNGTDSLVMEKTFEYNKYQDVSKEKVTNSKLELTENIYKYTGDFDYNNLIAQNILSLPVQAESRINGKVRSGTILKYNNFGAITERFNFNSNVEVPAVTYNTAANVPAYYEKKESLFYDATKKNIQEIKIENGASVLYLWSYFGQYPIAEIKNADYTIVQAVLGAAAITDFASRTPTAAEVNMFLQPLRNDVRLKSAIITTYTFDPLIGMTSVMDNRGATLYYEYDSIGRLKLIKDQNGKILKQYDYQYQKPINQ